MTTGWLIDLSAFETPGEEIRTDIIEVGRRLAEMKNLQ